MRGTDAGAFHAQSEESTDRELALTPWELWERREAQADLFDFLEGSEEPEARNGRRRQQDLP